MIRHTTTWILVLFLAGSFAAASLGSSADDEAQKPRKETVARGGEVRAQPRYTAEEQVLLDIQAEGRLRIRGLAEQIRNESDPERRAELERQAVEIKKQTRIRFLETLAKFARQRGDEVVEQQALDQIDNIKNPPRYEGVPARQTSEKSKARKGAK